MFPFLSVWRFLKFLYYFLFDSFLVQKYVIFHIFVDFKVSSCNSFLMLHSFCRKRFLIWFQPFLIWQEFFCGLIYDLLWRILHVYLRGLCILLISGGMICKYPLDPPCKMYSWSPMFILLIFYFFPGWSLYCWKWSLNSLTIIIWVCVYSLRSVNICFIYIYVPQCWVYEFTFYLLSRERNHTLKIFL